MSEPIQPTGERASEPAPETPLASWRPWGVFASLGLTACILVLYLMVQIVLVLAFALPGIIQSFDPPSLEQSFGDGTLLALSMLIANPVFALLVVLLARARTRMVRAYLGWFWAGWKPMLGWTAAVAGFLVCFDLLGSRLGRPPVPEVMLDLYRSAEPRALIWIVLVVMAPLFEELLFRGFLIPGLLDRMGAPSAVLTSSLIFALIHVQYDLFDMGMVLVLGAMFGIARVATGSTLLPMALHAAVNLASAVQMEWLARGG